jgi:FixJ family two-component response regulator
MPLIYVFDYDEHIVFVLCQWLNQNGFKAKGFTVPGQLLAYFQTSMPDCIILDSLYGGLTSTRDLCNTIQHIFHYKGKILLSTTGKISHDEWEECDAIDFINKPFELEEVLDKVNKLFDKSFA